MEYGRLLDDAFAYTKDAVIGEWKQWALLVLASIPLFVPLMGYSLRILRGEQPAPGVTGWGRLFIDGIRYLVVLILYAIPVLVILLALPRGLVHAILLHDTPLIPQIAGEGCIGFLILVIVAMLTFLILQAGLVRFARADRIGEAFNIGAITRTIGRIGWPSYILATILLFTIEFFIEFALTVFGFVPHLPFILTLIISGPLVLFDARFTSRLYDLAGPE